ncbi:MAG TPA: YCF48-related protein [Blastocatellia bacterium]|nr:YCF48-related protein [Blastocatellia bacterium]
MLCYRRVAFVVMLSLLAAAAFSCKNPQQNANQGGVRAGHWIAQYRSPSSARFAGTNLATFSYSSISVVSPTVVFVVGDMPDPKNLDERVAVVLRTTDGGTTWTERTIEQPNIRIPTLNSVSFANPNTGWAVGADSARLPIMLKTTDGGASWMFSRLDSQQVPTSVFFVDADTGWIAGATPMPGEPDTDGGPSDILATTDGGTTWRRQRHVPVTINDIFFLNRNEGWAGGYRGSIYHTTDGGRSWDSQRNELEPGDGIPNLAGEGAKGFMISGIHFVDREHGFASASDQELDQGRVLGSDDGGSVWSRRWIAGDSGVRDVFFATPTLGWAVTDYGHYIYHTADGGRNWVAEQVKFDQDVPFFKIAAADASHVWVVGGGAVFFRTSGS